MIVEKKRLTAETMQSQVALQLPPRHMLNGRSTNIQPVNPRINSPIGVAIAVNNAPQRMHDAITAT